MISASLSFKNVDLSEVVTKSLKVFVSSDRDENSFKEYFVEMPWLVCPFMIMLVVMM